MASVAAVLLLAAGAAVFFYSRTETLPEEGRGAAPQGAATRTTPRVSTADSPEEAQGLEPAPAVGSPCKEPIHIERVEEALMRVERDPSVRACIETPAPKEEALFSTYSRFLWWKAAGFRKAGDLEREIATLTESAKYEPQVGTQVAIASALHRAGRLEEARKQIAATALVAMQGGTSSAVLEDLFYLQVLVDRDAYENEPDQFGKERLCRSAGRFLQLAGHHAFSEGNVKAVRELQAERCPDAGKP
jgi:hypothetical protein